MGEPERFRAGVDVIPPTEQPGPARGPWSYLSSYRTRVCFGALALLATCCLSLTIPWLLGRTVDALQGPDPAGEVPALAVYMVLFAIAQACTRIASRIALFNAARMAEYDLRSNLFRHLMTLEPAFYRETSTGDVMSRLTSDVQTVRAMWGVGILNLINTTFIFGVAMFLMLGIDPWLTLWALVPYPSMVVLGSMFGKRIYRASRAVQEQLGKLSSELQEDLTGINVIKTYTLEDERERLFRESSTILLRRNMTLTKIRGQLVPVLGAVASLGTVIILYVGGNAVIDDRIELGELIQFNGYLALLVWPTLALGWMISLFQRGMASWRRLVALLETEPAIADGAGEAITEDDARGEVEFRNLTVELDGRRVLDNVSLKIPAGSITAIVGRIGSGKSTLVETLPRFIDVPKGSVFVDGRDVTDLPLEDLRRAIGYAPQEAFLFSATIADNIAFGYQRRGDEIGDEQATVERDRAATAAGLSRDLSALPGGFETMVGERGITLSGGQRQRVALARAIATSPRILILDDSLSSVDAETEREILGHLAQVMKDRTSILISHRVAAVKRADQIAVLEEGRLVELGTHSQLLDKGGVYAELYRTQLEDEVLG